MLNICTAKQSLLPGMRRIRVIMTRLFMNFRSEQTRSCIVMPRDISRANQRNDTQAAKGPTTKQTYRSS